MTARELIFSGFAWLPMFGQDAAGLLQERPRLPNVDRLCGRLISVRDVDSPVSNRSTPLTPVAVRLHRRTGDNDCCNGATVAAELVTGRRGKSNSRKFYPGCTGLHSQHTVKNSICWFDASQGRGSRPRVRTCSNEIDDAGHFQLQAFITVD
jgi:hypothetical protein